MKLRERAETSSTSFKEVVNQALRIGLAASAPASKRPFKVQAFSIGLRPGINRDKLSQVLDELEAEEYLARQKR